MAGAFEWSHVWRVKKNAYPNPKQAQNSNAKAKSSFPLKLSCGRIKTGFST